MNTAPPQHCVLVVEDHAFQRRALVRVLKAMGITRVIEAGDGEEALALLASHAEPVDAVITDLDMPTMDGIALMRHVGQHAPRAGIVLLSAVERDLLSAVEWLAREQHVNLLGVLEKPVSAPALHRALCRKPSARSSADVAPACLRFDEIVAALAAGEFEAFLQPKVSLANGALAGAEALARWRHPSLGWVSPARFIPVIEGSALVEPFSLAILSSAARSVRWLEAAGLPGRIAVNAFPAWLDQPGMAERLTQAVARLGIGVERLTIEVTESAANRDLASALENLARLRLRGFTLSVDDFGTGFSSLQRLVSSPFSEIKLDRSFVSGVERDTPRWFVVESTIALAKKLGMKTVAEGIETEGERQLLRDAGCDQAQGYAIARPMSHEQFVAWCEAHAVAPQAKTGEVAIPASRPTAEPLLSS